jgi:putative transposase
MSTTYPADLPDPAGARKLLAGLAPLVPRLTKIWADAAYRGKELADWCKQQGDGWELEVVEACFPDPSARAGDGPHPPH